MCHAQQHGQKPEELSFEEFREVLSLVKPNVATGRDNVPGTIVRFLPESVLNQLYRAVVDRLSGREDAHVHSWAEFDICLVPKKGNISKLSNWRPISLVPTLYKVYESVHVEGFGQRAQTASESVGGVQARHAVLGHCLFSGGKSAESRRVG